MERRPPRFQERATQSLITKLEGGLNDRLEALLQNQPLPNYTHGYLAAMFRQYRGDARPPLPHNPLGMIPSLKAFSRDPCAVDNPAVKQTSRAQAIALFDNNKAEMPDVFYVQELTPNTATPVRDQPVPAQFRGVADSWEHDQQYQFHIRRSAITCCRASSLHQTAATAITTSTVTATTPSDRLVILIWAPAGSGIFGASHAAAAGVYKGLGYLPLGYDGVDNDGAMAGSTTTRRA